MRETGGGETQRVLVSSSVTRDRRQERVSWARDSSRGKKHTHTHATQRGAALHFLSELLKRWPGTIFHQDKLLFSLSLRISTYI